jgi:hypothetical protein
LQQRFHFEVTWMLRIIISPTAPKVNSNQQEKHIYEEVICVLDGKGLALPLNDWHTW